METTQENQVVEYGVFAKHKLANTLDVEITNAGLQVARLQEEVDQTMAGVKTTEEYVAIAGKRLQLSAAKKAVYTVPKKKILAKVNEAIAINATVKDWVKGGEYEVEEGDQKQVVKKNFRPLADIRAEYKDHCKTNKADIESTAAIIEQMVAKKIKIQSDLGYAFAPRFPDRNLLKQ